jgi:23S rRNA (cytosine1962-C5)-methyltransferase
MTKIVLKPGKDEALARFHPWIFSGAIDKAEGHPQEGDVVEIYAADNRFIGRGHCAIGSIAVRMLSFDDQPIDQQFWNERIKQALNVRERMGLAHNPQTTCYRLVHGEGDLLPGLIVDLYGTTAVIQCHSAGMYLHRQEIAQAIQTVFGEKINSIYDKSAQTLPQKVFDNVKDEFLLGHAGKDVVSENGLRFMVDWETGQKTGFFLDQRENRKLLGTFCEGKKVLNTFCYTGGFSVYALAGGAIQVDSVDSSAKAMLCCDENILLNFENNPEIVQRHTSITADALKFLQQNDTVYDVVILDPPAFAKHSDALKNALQAYKRINLQAFQKIAQGGILFTFSCSQAVNKDQFRNAVFSAAAISGRKVRILHQIHQPADHPINIFHPEGEYLKGLVLYVE